MHLRGIAYALASSLMFGLGVVLAKILTTKAQAEEEVSLLEPR